MEFDEIITARHSIREYQNKEVKHEILCEILDSAKQAPSSGNIQNWTFMIVNDKKKMSRLAKACLDQDWITTAPVLIVVCYNDKSIKTLFPKKYVEFSLQNTTIASTYIMLKAVTLGLGTCWIDIEKKEDVANCLKLPNHIIPSHLITIGYHKGQYKRTSRNEISIVTYFEEYGKRTKSFSPFPLDKTIRKIKKKITR
ncbi:MAG: nitroreductase family protein [Nanoarchaeota archaeon]